MGATGNDDEEEGNSSILPVPNNKQSWDNFKCIAFFATFASLVVGLLTLGVFLVYNTNVTVCPDCQTGYASSVINGVTSCVREVNEVVDTYVRCHKEFIEPGFGIGAACLSVGCVLGFIFFTCYLN